MNAACELSEPHAPHWVNRAAFPLISLLLFATQFVVGLAVHHDHYWLALPFMLLASHLMHGQLIGFHEASHGMLRKNRTLNEIDGMLIGVFSLVSFTLYRVSHQSHHSHLGSERDDELWPFVNPSAPRWARLLAAALELSFGLFYTPFLFLRTFLRRDSPIRARRIRRRIWLELLLTVVVWTGVLVLTAVTGGWKYFLWLYFLPAWLAGNMQSVRKYIEHVGLTGSTINSATRSIVADTFAGRLISLTLLHEPYHGVHHLKSGVPHAELPIHQDLLQPKHPDEHPPFASYWHAFLHLFQCLKDPRVGAQWNAVAKS